MSKKPGRNDPCPCGSGKKYKNCHWGKDQPPSQTSRPSLFGRTVASTTSSLKKKITAKVISSGGPKDIVERTFSASLLSAREEGGPPVPPSKDVPEQVLPQDYEPWTGNEQKD